MQKLVMVYTDSDECSYSCESTIPFEYESIDKAMKDFTELVKTTAESGYWGFKFIDTEFTVSIFAKIKYDKDKNRIVTIDPPEFYSLETWFELYKLNK